MCSNDSEEASCFDFTMDWSWKLLCAGEKYVPKTAHLGTVKTTQSNNCCLHRCFWWALMCQCWFCCCVCPSQHHISDDLPFFLDGVIDRDKWMKAAALINEVLDPLLMNERVEGFLFAFVIFVMNGISYFFVSVQKHKDWQANWRNVQVLQTFAVFFTWWVRARMRSYSIRKQLRPISVVFFEPLGVTMCYRSRIAESEQHGGCSGLTFEMSGMNHLEEAPEPDMSDDIVMMQPGDTNDAPRSNAWVGLHTDQFRGDPFSMQAQIQSVLARGNQEEAEVLAASLCIPVDMLGQLEQGATASTQRPTVQQQKATSWVEIQKEQRQRAAAEVEKKREWTVRFEENRQASIAKRNADQAARAKEAAMEQKLDDMKAKQSNRAKVYAQGL
jgi:hypothetical protein